MFAILFGIITSQTSVGQTTTDPPEFLNRDAVLLGIQEGVYEEVASNSNGDLEGSGLIKKQTLLSTLNFFLRLTLQNWFLNTYLLIFIRHWSAPLENDSGPPASITTDTLQGGISDQNDRDDDDDDSAFLTPPPIIDEEAEEMQQEIGNGPIAYTERDLPKPRFVMLGQQGVGKVWEF